MLFRLHSLEAYQRFFEPFEVARWAALRWSQVAEPSFAQRSGFYPVYLVPVVFELVQSLQRKFGSPEEAHDFLLFRPFCRFRSWRIRLAVELVWDDDPSVVEAYAKALDSESRTIDLLTLQSLWREARIYADTLSDLFHGSKLGGLGDE